MTKSQTNICKGVAVLLLLWHHLFYQHPEYGVLVVKTALWCNICVPIFLMLSGYGLYLSTRKLETTSDYNSGEFSYLYTFYSRRFMALMPNYWVICILGIGVNIFFYRIMPAEVFPASKYPWGRVILQMFGLHMLQSTGWGYNPTWWFMTTIIILYVCYPLLHIMFTRFPVLALSLLTCLSSLGCLHIPTVGVWIIPFIYGIFIAHWTTTPKPEDIGAITYLKKLILWPRTYMRGGYFEI